MDKEYDFDEKNHVVRIYSPVGIKTFCREHKIKIEEFNLPVLLDDSITHCSGMFQGCTSFNQPVVIPERVAGCMDMFCDCKAFNQPVKMPAYVVQCARMFVGCSSFNQPIELPKYAAYCYDMFAQCKSFNQKIELPLRAENTSGMFAGCSSFNQEIVLGENIINCWSMFANCAALNQKIELHNTHCLYNNMFLNCTSLCPENVTIYSGRITQKTLEKRLRQMWGRDEAEDIADIEEKVNIVKVKTIKKIRITDISYTLEGNPSVELEEEELTKLTSAEIFQKLEELYSTQKLTALEISTRSASSMKTLAVYFDKELSAISVIDDWDESVSYYNSGEGKEPVEIRGNFYPRHMVSGDRDILFLIIEDFLKTGKPSKQVKWIRE